MMSNLTACLSSIAEHYQSSDRMDPMCVCVFVRERERERERKKDGERQRETDRVLKATQWTAYLWTHKLR